MVDCPKCKSELVMMVNGWFIWLFGLLRTKYKCLKCGYTMWG